MVRCDLCAKQQWACSLLWAGVYKLLDSPGVAWTSFNAAQRQARRGIMPLYTTSRPLVKNVENIAQHTFVPLFAVQVRP